MINKYSNAIPKIESEFLLSHIFRCERFDLYMKDFKIDSEVTDQYDSLVNRRLAGEPLQYIIGTQEFMDLDFIVNKDVFIPRPETELLIDEILRFTRYASRFTILDLCTGCGNIAITLAKMLPLAQITAADISESALKVAQRNSLRHRVNEKITFYRGYLFKAFEKSCKFDIIVCNPPYIKSSEVQFLQREVTREPNIALDGGIDGLDFYRRIAKEAFAYLKPEGSLFLEIGFDQAHDVKEIFTMHGFGVRKTLKDFAGIERVTHFHAGHGSRLLPWISSLSKAESS